MILRMTAVHPFNRFRKFIAAMLLAVTLIAAVPRSAFADGPGKIDDDAHYDARTQGYTDPDVELPPSTNGGAWVLLIFCGVVCVAVIFKDAKRSHLD
jgi:hypothetical protein